MTYLLINTIPVVWFWCVKFLLKKTVSWKEVGAVVFPIVILNVIVIAVSLSSQTEDFEIWNGKVISKERKHGHYVESYRCRCRQKCSGSGSSSSCREVCDTCYRDHYTVKWIADTTIGTVTFKSLDRTSRSVYKSPDPSSYTNCEIGEPASLEKSYQNYVKAASDSIFNKVPNEDEYIDKIPDYPRVMNFYRVDRILFSGIDDVEKRGANNLLSKKLITLGPEKQANIIIVLSDSSSRNFRYALERAWQGGKKNDVIVVLGTPDYPNISWVEIIAYSDNKLFDVTLQRELQEMSSIKSLDEVVNIVAKNVANHYTRKPMADFEYLKAEIKPAPALLAFMVIFNIAACAAGTYWAHRYDAL